MSTDSAEAKKKLYFVKSPGYGTSTAENFLKKRNFDINAETNIATALTQIFELQPDFVFIALDHPDSTIESLPKLVAQGCTAPVIPYITSSSRNEMRKLQMHPQQHKLYPPLSGPAVERLVLKTFRQAAEEAAKLASKEAEANSKSAKSEATSDMTVIKSSPNQYYGDKSQNENASMFFKDDSHDANYQRIHQQSRNNSIQSRNSILKNSKAVKMSNDTISALKNSVDSKIKNPLSSLLSSLQESKNAQGQGASTDAGSAAYNPQQSKEPGNLNPAAQIQEGRSAGAFQTDQEVNSNSNNISASINQQGQDQTSGAPIYSGTGGMAGGFSIPQGRESSKHQNDLADSITAKTHSQQMNQVKAYCMALYSDNWCGYLVITTEAELDFSTVDIVFTEWIKMQFDNLQEVDEYDYFELNNTDYSTIQEVIQNADYHEAITVNNFDLQISFFQVDPKDMNVELNEDKTYIKIQTVDIPPGLPLDFSLHLHLPENKKYILYTAPHKILKPEQKDKLIGNNKLILYTSLDFEKEFKKFLAEKNVKIMYEALQNKVKH